MKEGRKYDTGKPMVTLISPVALNEIAKVLTFGAQKYDPHNWRSGIKWSRILDAQQRHMLSFIQGEDYDQESGLSHLAHAGACITFLLEYQQTRTDFDDRYKIPAVNLDVLHKIG